ncbi:Uncharacterised protein [Mycobacterium tuberculosis]|nr:Uncharacterised protein [Mycobacterium tuberculosis]
MLNPHDGLVISRTSCHFKVFWHFLNQNTVITHDRTSILNTLIQNRWRFKVDIALFPMHDFWSQT